MTISPFFHFFPDIARKETRTVRVAGMPGLPDGEYGFFESYCVDPTCDCRRVLVSVACSATPESIWATINYGWESAAFYGRWIGDMADAEAAKGPTLDPFNPQSIYAPVLLRLFRTIIQDRAYEQRFKQHYRMIKDRVKATGMPSAPTNDDDDAPVLRPPKVPRGRRS